MTNDRAAAELEQFLAGRADRFLRTAVLLTRSREAATVAIPPGYQRVGSPADQ